MSRIGVMLIIGCAVPFDASAYCQPVTQPIVMPPPTFNPSYPNTVKQPPYKPLSSTMAGSAAGYSATKSYRQPSHVSKAHVQKSHTRHASTTRAHH